MAVNGTITKTSFTTRSAGSKVVATDINTLKTAIANLDSLKGNVNNCNCAASNC